MLKNIRLRPLVNFYKYSTQPVAKETPNYDNQIKEFERISKLQQKVRPKKPQRAPFVKNLFLGVFDTDLLTYPEITNEELNNLNKALQPIQTFVQQPEIKDCNKITRDFLKKLSNAQLLGLQAAQLNNGRELTVTEMCRFFEVLSELKIRNLLIHNEVLAIQTLVKFGSDQLKHKYLEKLVKGEATSAFCVLESKSKIGERTGVKNLDGKTWVLNGERKSVLNGSNADFYIVMANTQNNTRDEITEKKFSFFVVERDFGGITSTSCGGNDLSDVIFENVTVPHENTIGGENCGEEILSTIYPQYRLSTGPLCSVLVKNLINNVTEHFIRVSKKPNLLYETDAIRTKLGQLTTSLYAIDSMVYFTSSLVDDYENQDSELETSIVKVFASEQAFLNTSACLDLIAPDSVFDNHWCKQLHAEALSQVILNDSNDNLKILIALFGLRHAGEQLNETIKKIRNPFYFSTYAFKRMWTRRRIAEDNPKLNLYLHHYLHPSSMLASQQLEYCVLKLQYATETLLARHGPEVLNKHQDLRRLADAIIDIYAMVACISRSSRSYCIGLQHADYEMVLANAFTLGALERVKLNLNKIIEGPIGTNDENYRMLAKRLFELKQYYPVHPLSRNF
ncbi:Acyl-CoA dehydrogenase family member 9, mitochondrial-like Protein [Tribolium castaneum]|uniref:Acyl-CoA dehydrogenase family member 9, mitochondrial-like Protein n=1 Tax=Tribolium castaneum TaxID=7070 RepID=D6WCN5_TRICA|nr:PREDICTED: acyl-CoA dehydrogenase family member 9, mitochondrial [Tribolium castaneum]EEZ98802.2 Acyl-CoA dehydrogenase family member 9, mitochondrial-like Protein [Tribolium castaneum]|eukprot:XP_008190394.1 PREDICTED: acyl-CoA dehydrogenase family member 9, mitochondrial [Tribolium castaneum]